MVVRIVVGMEGLVVKVVVRVVVRVVMMIVVVEAGDDGNGKGGGG